MGLAPLLRGVVGVAGADLGRSWVKSMTSTVRLLEVRIVSWIEIGKGRVRRVREERLGPQALCYSSKDGDNEDVSPTSAMDMVSMIESVLSGRRLCSLLQ